LDLAREKRVAMSRVGNKENAINGEDREDDAASLASWETPKAAASEDPGPRVPWKDYTQEDAVEAARQQVVNQQRYKEELRERIASFDADSDGNIDVRELRRVLMSDDNFKQVLAQVVGSVGALTSHIFDEMMALADTNQDGLLSPEEFYHFLVNEAARLAEKEPEKPASLSKGVVKVEHVKEAKHWAIRRLVTAHRRTGSPSPDPSPIREVSCSEDGEVDILGLVVREVPAPEPEPEKPEVSLEELVARELKEQSEFLSEMTHRRDHGRQQLSAAKKVERKHQETMRYMGARHRELLRKIAEKKISLPPLCPCGVACLEPHADNCCNNCVFYKNPHAYEQALSTLLASFEVSTL
jgi:hypothetical protein